MNQDPRDRELEDAYRDAATETPPPDLDARILAAAHRAVEARPAAAGPRAATWFDRYRVPLSLAATVVIAVTVSLTVEYESRRAPEADAPRAAPPPRPTDARQSQPAPAANDRAVSPAPPAAAQREPERKAVEALRREPAAPPAAASPVVPAPAAAPAPAAPAPPPAPAPAAAPYAPAAAPARQPAPMEERAPPGTSAAGAPAPAAKPAARPMESRERNVDERPERATRDEAAPHSRVAPAAPAARPPAERIADIRRLRAEGRIAEAEAALAALVREFPDLTLPDDLRR